ncbi:ATP-binding protein, partial [Salinispira pacifica]
MNPIPRGTVTFLFTDIEGSTRLWATHPQQMKAVQVRHDDLVRRAVEECGGYVFKTVGDQTCAAFADANDGLRAAVDAQRAIQAEQWPAETGPLKVRMGLHTGSVEMRDGDYFGFVLSQIARLHAAAHGGQILISRATSELVQDRIPGGLALQDLGAHRLKDLLRPEQVFQVDVSDLPSVFPPLKTLDSVPNNLPIEPYPLVGRSAEIAEAKRLLQSTRLLTLTGPGGTGKTRLALQIGAESLGSYADGVFFVPLAQVSEPEHVPASIANALSVMERPHEDISSTLLSHLSDHELLLLLDNMEQVLPAATSVSRLLERAPKLKVIVTSREPLHVQGEQEFVVPPLLMPETGCDEPLEVISQYEAVELFIQRGRAVNPAFQVTNANAPAVAELCVRLDGLPLAIELAASRMKVFTPKQLLDRLGRHLSVLSGNRRDSPERHQTLRNTIEWSYNLLTEPERLLFERLAVFAGGFTVEAAEEVCGSATARTAPIEVVEGIESLIDKSLIQAILDDEETEPRFRMLQTIREYALSRFDADAQAAGVRDAHAAWYANLAEGFREVIWGSASSREEKVAWMRRISIEYDNIHAALEWASTSGQPVNAFRIVGALLQYYVDQFKLREALDWSKRLLAKPACVERKLLGPVYRVAATAAHFLGDEKGYREFAALT